MEGLNENSPEVDSDLKLIHGFDFADYWAFRLLFILFGYSTVVLPSYLLIVYVRRKFKDSDHRFRLGYFADFLRLLAIGRPEYRLIPSEPKSIDIKSLETRKQNATSNVKTLLFLFVSIQVFFISMGFFQERITTQPYQRSDGSFLVDKFGDSQFLVLMNRFVALSFCCLYFMYDYKNQPPHVPPLYKHSFCSLSNTLSSWCQYEALKFVSFPAMTVCKASKLIPTMLMGRLIRNKSYSASEYFTAFVLISGASLFLLSTDTFGNSHSVTTLSGVVLMAGYLAFDSFTPNWQKKLFDCKPEVSKTQMMFGVNAFSAVLCFVSLLEQGTLFKSVTFMLTHAGFAQDVFFLSLFGACGQVCIYAIIKKFGPEVLAVVMTLRQIFSIVLSAFYFSHPISLTGVFGLMLVFAAIFISKYSEYQQKISRQTLK